MASSTPISRTTVDLSQWPDLVVVYLGMQVHSLQGFSKLMATGAQIRASVQEKPDGLLLHEDMLFSLVPLHLGMRQYWRDLESLEAWTREGIHRGWWTSFLKDPKGTSFWHETYRRSGGIEAIYDNMTAPIGMLRFAPAVRAKGPMFTARSRLGDAAPAPDTPVTEAELG